MRPAKPGCGLEKTAKTRCLPSLVSSSPVNYLKDFLHHTVHPTRSHPQYHPPPKRQYFLSVNFPYARDARGKISRDLVCYDRQRGASGTRKLADGEKDAPRHERFSKARRASPRRRQATKINEAKNYKDCFCRPVVFKSFLLEVLTGTRNPPAGTAGHRSIIKNRRHS